MSFRIFQRKVKEIRDDIGPFLEGVMTAASEELRYAIAEREKIPPYGVPQHHWVAAHPEDFVRAAERLEELFGTKTQERIVAVAEVRGSRCVQRPSAIWLEGKKYRVRLVTIEGAQVGDELRWVAEATDFAKVAVWGHKFGPYDARAKKALRSDHASEHLANGGMRTIFEKVFNVTLS